MLLRGPINAAPDKFRTNDIATLTGLPLVAAWCARHQLLRTDKPGEVSARWGFERDRTVVWCFPDSSRRPGLELWLKRVSNEDYGNLHGALIALARGKPSE